MLEFDLGNAAITRSLHASDAKAVHNLVTASRDHLDSWLRWSSSIKSVDDAQSVIADSVYKESGGDGFLLGIWVDGQLAAGSSAGT